MAVDRGYGTGSVKPTPARSGSASLRKKGVKAAARKYTKVTTSKAKSIAGSSEYVQRENAARTQLGTAGVAARARQLPTAARAFTREMTGIDISRKGVSVDPLGVAMALPLGKVLKAAKVVRAAGLAGKASAMEARNVAKLAGREAGKRIAKANNPATVFGVGRTGEQVLSDYIRSARSVGKITREASESVFPRAPKKGPMGQPDLGDLGAGRVGLPFNTPAQIRRANRARRATQAADRVYELEKRLNLPGKAPKRGR